MINTVLKILLLVTPIAYLRGMPLPIFDLNLFRVGVMALFLATFFDNPKREIKWGMPLAVFMVLVIGSSLVSGFSAFVVTQVTNIFIGIVALVIIFQYAEPEDGIYKYIVWAGMINIVAMGLQYLGWMPVYGPSEHTKEFGGLMGNAPRLVTYLAITMPLWPSALLIIPVAVSLIAKEYMILPVALAILWKNRKLRIPLFAAGVAVMFFIYPKVLSSIKLRWTVWRPTLEVFLDRPFLGHGIGIFPRASRQFLINGKHHADTAFSSILQFIFGVGLIGAAWIGYVVKNVIKNFDWSKEHLAVLAVILLSAVEYPFEIRKCWITLVAIIGFYLIKKSKKEENKNEKATLNESPVCRQA